MYSIILYYYIVVTYYNKMFNHLSIMGLIMINIGLRTGKEPVIFVLIIKFLPSGSFIRVIE